MGIPPSGLVDNLRAMHGAKKSVTTVTPDALSPLGNNVLRFPVI